jgi:hypothetical protein
MKLCAEKGLNFGQMILHHDNAPAQEALSVKQFLAQKLINEMEHPPYSPDLAPNVSENKACLKGMKISGY